jgi:hypothetical protein
MNRGNVVTLTGEFRVVKLEVVQRKEHEELEIEATVRTGPKNLGGIHRVILLSETARLANAFIKANGGDGMFVTVIGTLYSGSDFAIVHAGRIVFHVPPYIQEEGRNIYRGY